MRSIGDVLCVVPSSLVSAKVGRKGEVLSSIKSMIMESHMLLYSYNVMIDAVSMSQKSFRCKSSAGIPKSK